MLSWGLSKAKQAYLHVQKQAAQRSWQGNRWIRHSSATKPDSYNSDSMIDRTTLHSMNDYILHAAAHIRSNDCILIRNPPTAMFRNSLALSYWTSIIIGRLAGPESVLSTFEVVTLSDVEAVRPRLWRSQSTEDPPSSSSPAAFTHRTSGNRFDSLIPSSPPHCLFTLTIELLQYDVFAAHRTCHRTEAYSRYAAIKGMSILPINSISIILATPTTRVCIWKSVPG